jgi:phosphoglycolate phosphatase-like HAD superfamily hydrolase
MTKQLVIFDIDGTLADNEHRVHHLHKTPKDWDTFFAGQDLDTLNEDVVHVYRMYQRHIPHISMAMLTGRGEEHREVTQGWLAEHRLTYQKLAMRPAGDRTNDDVIKLNVIKA